MLLIEMQVADVAADAVAVADAAGLGQFAVWGVGGGGPHALACAAMLPDRVLAAAVVEPVAPVDAAGLDWSAGMAAGNVEEFTLALAGRGKLASALAQATGQLAAVNAEQVADVFGAGLPARDREVLSSPQVAAFLLACLREGLTAGPEGWIEDDLAFVAPWGVDLAGTRVPVTLWHGQQDWPTPASHARWLADTIPDAELRLVAEEGALSVIFRHASEVIGWLSAHLPNRR